MESDAQPVPPSPRIFGVPNSIGGVCNASCRILERRFVNEALAGMEQLFVADPMGTSCDGLEADVRPDSEQRGQKSPGYFVRRQCLPGAGCAEQWGKFSAQVDFFQHIQQAGHGPAPGEFGL